MESLYDVSAEAQNDLFDIWRRIAEDNEPAADRFIDLLTHHYRLLGEMPYAGRRATKSAQATAASLWANT